MYVPYYTKYFSIIQYFFDKIQLFDEINLHFILWWYHCQKSTPFDFNYNAKTEMHRFDVSRFFVSFMVYLSFGNKLFPPKRRRSKPSPPRGRCHEVTDEVESPQITVHASGLISYIIRKAK